MKSCTINSTILIFPEALEDYPAVDALIDTLEQHNCLYRNRVVWSQYYLVILYTPRSVNIVLDWITPTLPAKA